MPTLQKISLFLRNILVKQHLYFLCCASCGEIKTPLESRLCTSLPVSFPVDAVLLENDLEKALITAEYFEEYAPWLRHIFIILQQDEPAAQNERIHIIAKDRLASSPSHCLEAICHTIPNISEHFIIVPAGMHLARPCLPLDFFTPNGIPLLRLIPSEGENDIFSGYALAYGIFAQSKKDAADFLENAAELSVTEPADYYAAYAKWAFDAGHTIPAKG